MESNKINSLKEKLEENKLMRNIAEQFQSIVSIKRGTESFLEQALMMIRLSHVEDKRELV